MSDTPTPPIDPISPIPLQEEMENSFLDYAMSVIMARALPDVRDGLKPVHRRILYAMQDEGLLHNRKYSKCAGVVGEVLKKYHPHGDASVYDALVRLAQPWNMQARWGAPSPSASPGGVPQLSSRGLFSARFARSPATRWTISTPSTGGCAPGGGSPHPGADRLPGRSGLPSSPRPET